MNTHHGNLHPHREGLLFVETMRLWHRRGAAVKKEWQRRTALGALHVAASLAMLCATLSAQPATQSNAPASKRMLDGKLWTTQNLNLTATPSYCYDDLPSNCERYGRLYTWESAQQGCRALGGDWRLPTKDEWRELGKRYGGVRQESADLGKAAYTALMTGGSSGFDAVYGGGRSDKSGEYQRVDAHGFYWSATESGPDRAWLYNFGKGGQSFGWHENGEKLGAFSVRCVKD